MNMLHELVSASPKELDTVVMEEFDNEIMCVQRKDFVWMITLAQLSKLMDWKQKHIAKLLFNSKYQPRS